MVRRLNIARSPPTVDRSGPPHSRPPTMWRATTSDPLVSHAPHFNRPPDVARDHERPTSNPRPTLQPATRPPRSPQCWNVERRYRDFRELQTQLITLWPSLAELPFPPKHIAKMQPHVIEERIVALELFMRNCVSILGVYVGAAIYRPASPPRRQPTNQRTNQPPHHPTNPPLHHPTAPPLHRPTASPPHRPTNPPPHRPTNPPPHRLTASPPHQPTASPPHQPTNPLCNINTGTR